MIIGLSGKIGSGKSTVSEVFKQNGFELDSFAKSLKDVTNSIFGFDREKLEGFTSEDRIWRETPDKKYSELLGNDFAPFSPRDALILIGTTIGRNIIHPNIWIQTVFNRYEQNKNKNLLITDVRFPNEYEEIKKRGGFVIRINRPNIIYKNHISECALDDYEFDYVIENDSTLEDLYKKINLCLQNIQQNHQE